MKTKADYFKQFCTTNWQLPNGAPAFGSSGDFTFAEVEEAFNAGWACAKKHTRLVNKKEADNAHEPSSAPSSPPASADVDK